ncbi:MAG: glycosyltransferase family 4 protein [Candidatus Aminicenantes bacterium]|nr:glycosyltransferase family 4 protein [Candidatus Aminicenantes bacterium]
MKNINLEPIKQILSSTPFNPSQLRTAILQISAEHGPQAAYNTLLRVEVALKLRKPSLAIYDHTFHIIGGGQKYGFTAAHALQDMFDITLLLNKEISHQDIRDWYHLDLTRCRIKEIKIPFFQQFDSPLPDPARVSRRMENPFHIISRESGNYDFFINNSMNEMVYPLANVSAIICHFPERRPRSYFYADRYTHVIYNSRYTAHWIQQKWKFTPHKHIYPPVDMAPAAPASETAKENIILSVARFEEGGSKKQLEMVRMFLKLNRRFPALLNEWKLALVGGSPDENEYLKKIKELVEKSGAGNIRLMVNSSGDELKALYGKAKIFWHLCGLDQTDPALVEHFGMTIVEAMQNRLVPIVFDGGGQREIVDHGVNGFRVQSTAQSMSFTMKLINEPALREELGRRAFEKSKLFTRETFELNVREFFSAELAKYCSI